MSVSDLELYPYLASLNEAQLRGMFQLSHIVDIPLGGHLISGLA